VIDEVLTTTPSTHEQLTRRKSTIVSASKRESLSRRSTIIAGQETRSRRETLAHATAKYYAPQTQYLSKSNQNRNFTRMFNNNGNDGPKISIAHNELRRFTLVQVHSSSCLDKQILSLLLSLFHCLFVG
jgi:hypothetical protein